MDQEKAKRKKAALTGKKEETRKHTGAEAKAPARRKKDAAKIEPSQPEPETQKPVTEGDPKGFRGVKSIEKGID